MGHKWKNLDEAFGDLEQQVTEVTRGVITVLWRAILERTPQYSGQMVHSWTYSIGAPVAVDRPVFESLKGGPSWEGYKPNIAVAEGYNRGADRLFKLGDRGVPDQRRTLC